MMAGDKTAGVIKHVFLLIFNSTVEKLWIVYAVDVGMKTKDVFNLIRKRAWGSQRNESSLPRNHLYAIIERTLNFVRLCSAR